MSFGSYKLSNDRQLVNAPIPIALVFLANVTDVKAVHSLNISDPMQLLSMNVKLSKLLQLANASGSTFMSSL